MVYRGKDGGGGGEVFQTWRCETEEEWRKFEFGPAKFVMTWL